MIRCQVKKAQHEVQVFATLLTLKQRAGLFLFAHAYTSNYILKSRNDLTVSKSLAEVVDGFTTVDTQER